MNTSRNISRNTSRIGLAAAAALAASTFTLAHAAVPAVDAIGKGAVIRCGSNANGKAVEAFHADKIVFRLIGQLVATLPQDQPALDAIARNTGLDIKVLDNPRTVADLRGKVLTFLGAMDVPANRESVEILEVKYAMVCPTTFGP
jgi:hypothetical protein